MTSKADKPGLLTSAPAIASLTAVTLMLATMALLALAIVAIAAWRVAGIGV